MDNIVEQMDTANEISEVLAQPLSEETLDDSEALFFIVHVIFCSYYRNWRD
jgi:hypothetical protein